MINANELIFILIIIVFSLFAVKVIDTKIIASDSQSFLLAAKNKDQNDDDEEDKSTPAPTSADELTPTISNEPTPTSSGEPTPTSTNEPTPTSSEGNPTPTGENPTVGPNSNCPLKSKGDANCDNIINVADYEIWTTQFDTLVPGSEVNNNANFVCMEATENSRFVDLVEYEIWRRNTVSFN